MKCETVTSLKVNLLAKSSIYSYPITSQEKVLKSTRYKQVYKYMAPKDLQSVINLLIKLQEFQS